MLVVSLLSHLSRGELGVRFDMARNVHFMFTKCLFLRYVSLRSHRVEETFSSVFLRPFFQIFLHLLSSKPILFVPAQLSSPETVPLLSGPQPQENL